MEIFTFKAADMLALPLALPSSTTVNASPNTKNEREAEG